MVWWNTKSKKELFTFHCQQKMTWRYYCFCNSIWNNVLVRSIVEIQDAPFNWPRILSKESILNDALKFVFFVGFWDLKRDGYHPYPSGPQFDHFRPTTTLPWYLPQTTGLCCYELSELQQNWRSAAYNVESIRNSPTKKEISWQTRCPTISGWMPRQFWEQEK